MNFDEAQFGEAEPMFRLIDQDTNTVVGIEYRWNTGENAILWRTDPVHNVIREAIVSQRTCDQ
ncbi:MAG: hypothetical protein AAF583_01405 [Pseudomonadota bacterium]